MSKPCNDGIRIVKVEHVCEVWPGANSYNPGSTWNLNLVKLTPQFSGVFNGAFIMSGTVQGTTFWIQYSNN